MQTTRICATALLMLLSACSGSDHDDDREHNVATSSSGGANKNEECSPLEHFDNGVCSCNTDCNGRCIDRLSDKDNCGGCGNACGNGQVCFWGSCTDCKHNDGSGLACNDTCTNPKIDSNNCGECGHSCGEDGHCSEGVCCNYGSSLCNGACVDVTTNKNCGQCGNACAANESCESGTCKPLKCDDGFSDDKTACGNECVSLSEDTNHCGACGNVCKHPIGGEASRCAGGVCDAACATGNRYCASKNKCEAESATSCGNACLACANPVTGMGAATCEAGACSINCAPGMELTTDGTSCVPAVVGGGGGPQTGAPWPMLLHDAMHTGRGAGVALATPKVAWSQFVFGQDELSTINGVDRGALIDKNGDVVFSALSQTFQADVISLSNAALGNQVWDAPAASSFSYDSARGIAIAQDGTLYYEAQVTTDIDSLVARRRDGTKKWARTFGSNQRITAPTLGALGMIYFGDTSGNLHAMRADGTEAWVTQLSGSILTPPSIATTGTLRVATATANGSGTLVALSTTGTMVWQTALSGKPTTTPVISPDGSTYVVTDSGVLDAIKNSGTLNWQYDFGTAFVSQPRLLPDGSLIAQSFELASLFSAKNPKLTSLSSNGAVTWLNPISTSFNCLAVLDDGTIYTSTGDALLALRADGSTLFTFTTPGIEVISVGADNSLIVQASANAFDLISVIKITN